ncbi:MAG: hypothetical protein LBI08_00400, partial [Methanomassiliicoccaceae archaeon]|nr:hypothetical protein [Methanomassiliicoccaceae archaeon]
MVNKMGAILVLGMLVIASIGVCIYLLKEKEGPIDFGNASTFEMFKENGAYNDGIVQIKDGVRLPVLIDEGDDVG